MKILCLLILAIQLVATAVAQPLPARPEPALSSKVSADETPNAEAITSVLQRQQEHWNAGDIEAFVDDYWRSPELTFSSGGTTRRGFEATRERYLKSYPTPAKMGRLAFRGLEITPLSETAAMVLGRWQLLEAVRRRRAAARGRGDRPQLADRRETGRDGPPSLNPAAAGWSPQAESTIL